MSAPKATDRAAMRKAAGKCFDIYRTMRGETGQVITGEPSPNGVRGKSADNIVVDNALASLFRVHPARPKKKKNKAPEGKVVHACLELLYTLGIFAWRNNTGAVSIGSRFMRYGKTGSGDILGMTKTGQFLAIECKSSIGVQSPAQKLFQMQVEKNNGLYFLVTSAAELSEKLNVKP